MNQAMIFGLWFGVSVTGIDGEIFSTAEPLLEELGDEKY